MSQLKYKAVLILAVTITSLLSVQYLRLLQPAQARAVIAACNGLKPAANNKALGPMAQDLIAPNFSLVDNAGVSVRLSDFRGKIVIVNFWASWCSTCRSEKPSLERFQANSDDDDIVVLALASDNDWAQVNQTMFGFGTLSASEILQNPKQYGIRDSRKLGATGQDVVISRVDSGRAAFRGGMRWLDKVVSVNGTPISNLSEFSSALRGASTSLTLEVMHDGASRTISMSKNTPFQVLLDPSDGDDGFGRIAKQYGITAFPESFVVDREGKIRHYFINKRNWTGDVASTCLQDLIDE